MRRLSSVFVAAVLSASTFVIISATPAGAASTKSCASSMSGSKSNGMDMGGMDMGGGSKSMKNCPTVAGAREIPVTASAFQFSPSTITVAAPDDFVEKQVVLPAIGPDGMRYLPMLIETLLFVILLLSLAVLPGYIG